MSIPLTKFDSATNVKSGLYTITVTDAAGCTASDTIRVMVDTVWLTNISFINGNVKININQETVFKVLFTPANACNKDVIWHSGDTNIATVDANGKIRGISDGETSIVATSIDGGFQANGKIIVRNVGIGQLTMDNGQWIIYPNPTSSQLRIENYELSMGNIEIYDIYGRKIVNCPLSTVNSIDVSHLANGLYFLKIGNKTVKIVKN